jgi:hypothetical protein
LNGGLGFGLASPEAAFQLLDVPGLDKDSDGVGHGLQHRAGSLDVYLQDNPLTGFQARGYWLGRRSVPVSTPKNLETFKEFAIFSASTEFFLTDKPVLLTVNFPLPCVPGGR